MVYIEIIGLYRSTGNLRDKELLSDLTSMVNKDNICIILGDFNLRYTRNNPHMILQYLKNNSFCQLVDTPTHSRGGLIDHFYIRKPSGFENVIVNWHLYAPFYTDHFGVCVTINKGRGSFRKLESSLSEDTLRLLANSSNDNGNESNKKTNKKVNNKRKTCTLQAPADGANKKTKK